MYNRKILGNPLCTFGFVGLALTTATVEFKQDFFGAPVLEFSRLRDVKSTDELSLGKNDVDANSFFYETTNDNDSDARLHREDFETTYS